MSTKDNTTNLLWEGLESIPAFLGLRYEDRASIVDVATRILQPETQVVEYTACQPITGDLIVGEVETNDDAIHVYVDGSYNKDNNLTGAGVVVLSNGKIYKKGFLVETEEEHSWNIDGECHAVLEALKICSGEVEIEDIVLEHKNIIINYDYAGIEKWANREWKAKSKIARHYVQEFDKLVAKYKFNIVFNKVKAHSGDQFNDIADGLAYNIVTMKSPKKV